MQTVWMQTVSMRARSVPSRRPARRARVLSEHSPERGRVGVADARRDRLEGGALLQHLAGGVDPDALYELDGREPAGLVHEPRERPRAHADLSGELADGEAIGEVTSHPRVRAPQRRLPGEERREDDVRPLRAPTIEEQVARGVRREDRAREPLDQRKHHVGVRQRSAAGETSSTLHEHPVGFDVDTGVRGRERRREKPRRRRPLAVEQARRRREEDAGARGRDVRPGGVRAGERPHDPPSLVGRELTLDFPEGRRAGAGQHERRRPPRKPRARAKSDDVERRRPAERRRGAVHDLEDVEAERERGPKRVGHFDDGDARWRDRSHECRFSHSSGAARIRTIGDEPNMTRRPTPPLPDPDRLGGPAWMARTGGRLTRRDCLHGAAIAAVSQAENLLQRALPFAVRRVDVATLPRVPDSRLARLAEEAAMNQDETLRMHGFRSSVFARALAHGDGVDVDLELLHVCALLHDDGLMTSVVGQDFTVRSGATARRVADEAGEEPGVGRALEDAVLVHTTVGVSVERDGALGAYTQFGAMVDLVGLRLHALPKDLVRKVIDEHPRGPFKREILRRFDAEVEAVPHGRFAFAQRVGFGAAVRMAPFPT